ncbi:MAG: helicase associated domain-containing protein [Acutalibacteraceae bacterium]|nr:helicase associated domain-containing protein [Acutalibacteraceae bacterium]
MKQSTIDRMYQDYELVKEYYDIHKDLTLTNSDVANALRFIRDIYAVNQIPDDLKAKYDDMNMIWDIKEAKQARKALEREIAANKEWETYFNLAKEYVSLFGCLDMPRDLTIEGQALGRWIEKQKEDYNNQTLSVDRANRLAKIGLEWNTKSDHISYDESVISYYVSKVFKDAISSYRPPELNGKELDIYIPSLKTGIEFDGIYHKKSLNKDEEKNKLCRDNGFKLIRVRTPSLPKMRQDDNCIIVNSSRSNNNVGKIQTVKDVLSALGVSPEQMPDIDIVRDRYNIHSIMIEDKTAYNEYLHAAKMFYEQNGHLLVPRGYKTSSGIKLGKWIRTLRNPSSDKWLSSRQRNALDEIGMVWKNIDKASWLHDFERASSMKEIPETEKTLNGKSLGEWFNKQKEDFNKGLITDDYKLEAFNNVKVQKKERGRSHDEER